MGAERELVLISGIIAAVLVMSLERIVFTIVGVVFWSLSLAVLQRLRKLTAVQPRLPAPHALPRILRGTIPCVIALGVGAGGNAVLALREFRSTAKGLPDLLNYAAVVDDGVVLNKDGSLMAAWSYRGEDLDSASVPELSALSPGSTPPLRDGEAAGCCTSTPCAPRHGAIQTWVPFPIEPLC